MKCYPFCKMSILTLWPIQPPICWVLGHILHGAKWSGCEAEHSPTLKISGAIPPLPHMPNYFSISLFRNRDLKSLGTITFMAGFNYANSYCPEVGDSKSRTVGSGPHFNLRINGCVLRKCNYWFVKVVH